jgi:hypothetical protein
LPETLWAYWLSKKAKTIIEFTGFPASDEILFNGLAPALIRAGIPAVVANQAPIKVTNATAFMEGFYSALARLEDVPDAVNKGRGRINDHEWYLPTLYLRDKDENGRLFT